ncbi:hypothetical protein RB595_009728 [Gaeumannomyces hyphopodioides]
MFGLLANKYALETLPYHVVDVEDVACTMSGLVVAAFGFGETGCLDQGGDMGGLPAPPATKSAVSRPREPTLPGHAAQRQPGGRLHGGRDSPTAPRLGSIFSSLRRLTGPLNQDEVLSVPTNLVNSSGTVNFQDTAGKSVKGRVGIFTSFVQGLSGNGDLIYAFTSDKYNTYRCEALETLEFEPDEQFVKDSITASLRVQDFLGNSNSFFGGRRVYMITGLKIATGFAMSSTDSAGHGPQLKVAVDVPVTGGPELNLTLGASRDISYGPASSRIVFAYRAIKISPKGDGEVRYKDLSGGTYGVGDDGVDSEGPFWVMEPVGGGNHT